MKKHLFCRFSAWGQKIREGFFFMVRMKSVLSAALLLFALSFAVMAGEGVRLPTPGLPTPGAPC
jgi:hypothetical protein